MSSRNLKWATYALLAIAAFNLYNVGAAIHLLANGNYKTIGFQNVHWVASFIAAVFISLGIGFSIWAYITSKRLKDFKQTAWKHAMIISCFSLLDVYMIPVALFTVYCLMDQNVRFLFKKRNY